MGGERIPAQLGSSSISRETTLIHMYAVLFVLAASLEVAPHSVSAAERLSKQLRTFRMNYSFSKIDNVINFGNFWELCARSVLDLKNQERASLVKNATKLGG